MLSRNQLETLHRTHRDQYVLSIYLNADQHDFAERSKWRVALKNRVADQRKRAADPVAFDQAYGLLEAVLRPEENSFLPGRGWAGFATSEDRLYAASLPLPMPDLVRWEKGIRIAPYVRALSICPVVAVVIDSRRARLRRYGTESVTKYSELEADTYLGDLTDVSVTKRASGHSGVRGQTGTDAANRLLEVERDRLFRRVASEIQAEAGNDGMVVIGGVGRAVEALTKELDLPDSSIARDPSLSLESSVDELRASVERARAERSQHVGSELVEEAVGRARSGGDGCLGKPETLRALLERRVDTLLVSERLRREQPDDVDRAEGTAFEQGATVVEISGEAGVRLDGAGGGLAALLRYRAEDAVGTSG